MKIDVTQEFKTYNKEPMMVGEEKKEIRTLKYTMIVAVLTPSKEDDVDKKIVKYRLFQRLDACTKDIELKVEEIAMFKKLIGESMPQLIVGQAWDMLEGKTK